MQLKDFYYHLPTELIAQEPAQQREAARLMTLDRRSGEIGEGVVADMAGLFVEGDLLVINDTRVIPARLLGRKETGGKAEVFLVRRRPGAGQVWQCLIKSSKPPVPESSIHLAEGVTARIVERDGQDSWLVSFSPEEGFLDRLDRIGNMPLPPYIRRAARTDDGERYQTVFARERGAVAAPTAGLHFTESLLQQIRERGVDIVPLTLHVGLGTFMPVRVQELREHRMHREYYRIPATTAQAVTDRKKAGKRVIALGTTTTRALEHAAAADGSLVATEGEADIFILPGYEFKAVDALITNFHLPESTLLMLVSAFAGKDKLFNAYAEAVRRKFRFFSYGDAMFIH
ncbi:tRNA preQ1(34) S-adenosylmethionine ribosyltransferase-isomerase QueA [Geotalea sp. SG265]|uniref:tRNA preQ1(34) S-adenosylmethionine ribosyltransferase-isomerase QueA n=1 Tax=Geotalea sp. SG265 TaxID=2922867 RepID=UPI001FAF5204|nr:tRNA preQ1(34) S-adenosylmethionine ribosyltransferase-isomerase QueA [Geotalea sp. SG265]